MRERGNRINLHPDVEANCIVELSEHCSDNEEHEEKNGVSKRALKMCLE